MFNTLSYIGEKLNDADITPNREIKVEMIEKYIFKNGIEKPILLERALDGCLPSDIRARIKNILT